MKVVRKAAEMTRISENERCAGNVIGFVPTMGCLHEGHLALVRRAHRDCDIVIASIFVNPLQFGPAEDFAAYPRDLRGDHAALVGEGVDWVFQPSDRGMYPAEFVTMVSVTGLDQSMCGRCRPGHFSGVATVVAKLLLITRPHILYLGRKDYQQARIIERMVRDLDMGVRVVAIPTVREEDGLALSSRNTYLTAEERAWAPNLHRALAAVAGDIRAGRIRRPSSAIAAVRRRLAGGPGALEYVEVLSAEDLGHVSVLEGRLVMALAYKLGKARLIDNIEVRAGSACGALSRRGDRNRSGAAGRRRG